MNGLWTTIYTSPKPEDLCPHGLGFAVPCQPCEMNAEREALVTERDEALGLLRELVAYWDDENVSLPSAGDDWAEVGTRLGLTARDLKQRIRVLVER